MPELLWSEWSDTQRKAAIDTQQLHEALTRAEDRASHYAGSMSWQKTGAREYLVKSNSTGARRKSLGPRSAETEATYQAFVAGKRENAESARSLRLQLDDQARMNKAVRINRVPKFVSKVLMALHDGKLLGTNVILLGTNCLYAYEMAAGLSLMSGALATHDVDFLWDARREIELGSDDAYPPDHIYRVVRQADASLQHVFEGSFRLTGTGGQVDLIRQQPSVSEAARQGAFFAQEGWIPTELPNMKWLLSAPQFRQVAIGEDGLPVALCVPDPRAYAIYKLWLSQHPDREPLKRPRDRTQAQLVSRLVQAYLPHLPFSPEILRVFPQALAAQVAGLLEDAKTRP